jgi:hypothetical protein
MSCIEADYIAPKYSTATTILKANVIPVTTSATFVSTEATATITAYATGKLCEITVPQILFTGDGTVVTAGAMASLTAPAADCYWPIIVSDGGTKATGYALLTTTKTMTFAANATGGAFTGSAECYIYPTVLHYKSA